ncbi:MAG: transaldolase [Blastocatellia bacterium]|nr:MAG: transaldolase [Blastocatellia bacterium]
MKLVALLLFFSLRPSVLNYVSKTQLLEADARAPGKKAGAPTMNGMDLVLGTFDRVFTSAMKEAEDAQVAKRIWRRDASLWKAGDSAHEKIIRNSLGWLTVADEMIGVSNELTEFASFTRARNFRHVMVCGMGGSSLCPEVLARTFRVQEGAPELLVLDSTDPDVLDEFMKRIEIEKCLFIIASKSGATTEPTVFLKFWYDEVQKRLDRPGENFLAITDPGSPLVQTATDLGFQWVFLNQSDIGGGYSALSYFGMVPAALMGLDLKTFLDQAKEMSQACSAVMPPQKNPGLRLGVAIGECANQNRDKLTFVMDPRIESLGLWIEQLIAESTGKEGKGILPVVGEELGSTDKYGNDRVFVSISIGAPPAHIQMKLEALADAGHPVIFRQMNDLYDLGAEFFVWEFATACAGWRLGIDSFDQPNVQESKDVTKELLQSFIQDGHLPEQRLLVSEGVLAAYAERDHGENLKTDSLLSLLRSLLSTIGDHNYVALLNYFEETPEIQGALRDVRLAIRDAKKVATTTGFGPRFLHSTGQLHKGGPNTGVFFQLTAADKVDFPVPGDPYSFSILKQAQALGDFRALSVHGRRAVRIDLGADALTGLLSLGALIENALQNVSSTAQ